PFAAWRRRTRIRRHGGDLQYRQPWALYRRLPLRRSPGLAAQCRRDHTAGAVAQAPARPGKRTEVCRKIIKLHPIIKQTERAPGAPDRIITMELDIKQIMA